MIMDKGSARLGKIKVWGGISVQWHTLSQFSDMPHTIHDCITLWQWNPNEWKDKNK